MNKSILVDLDNVLYDLSTPWYKLHNAEHKHQLVFEDVDTWDVQEVCVKNNCSADNYSYFEYDSVWLEGDIIKDAFEYTKQLQEEGNEVVVLTTAVNDKSASLKLQWVREHIPHLRKDMMITTGHTKHWVKGDFLVDDGIHNLTSFTGCGILYAATWNKSNSSLIRANNWKHTYELIQIASAMLDKGFTHKDIEESIMMLQGNYKKGS